MTTLSSSQDKSRLLRSALLGNSIFCFLSGVVFALFPRPVSRFIGLPSSVVIFVLGIILVAYALVVFEQSRRQSVSLSFANFAITADVLWVIGSGVLIFTNLVGFPTAGKWAIAVVADIVLAFAIAQFVGLRRSVSGYGKDSV